MKWLYNQKLSKKLYFVVITMLIFMIGLGSFSIFSINELYTALTDVYTHRVIPLEQLKTISDAYEVNIIDASHKLSNNYNWEKSLDEINSAQSVISEHWQSYSSGIAVKEEIKLAEEIKNLMNEADNSISELKGIIANKDTLGLTNFINNELYSDIEPVTAKVTELISWQMFIAKEEFADGEEHYDSSLLFTIILITLGLLFSVLFTGLISKNISSSISKLIEIVEGVTKGNEELKDASKKIARGETNLNLEASGLAIDIHSKDEIGQLAASMKRILTSQNELTSSFNSLLTTLNQMITESANLTQNAVEGNLEYRCDANRFEGGYNKILNGFNETMNAIIKPINEGVSILQEVANGDLTKRINTEYKGDHQLIKNSINQLTRSMEQAIVKVSEAVQATSSAANEISSSSEEMAAGTQEQTQQVTEIAGAVEEMTRTILNTNKSINDAADTSKIASANAKKGSGKVNETKQGMKKIVEASTETAEVISSLSTKTEQIGEMAQVIDDIADQTNLLALNAAIEAARAGEQGRGFAVVADEVRKLAERTTKATKEIAETIKAIQNEARNADKAMELAKHAVEEGMELTNEVESVLGEILAGSDKVNDVVTQIAATSEEQSATAEQISRNIEGITTVAQQTATGTGQIARAAEDLSKLTVNLQELISGFRTWQQTVKNERYQLTNN